MNSEAIKSAGNFLQKNLEGFVWLLALLLLALMSPSVTQPSLCIFHQLGIDSCPGCGLGHSISAVFAGKFITAFEYHPLGLFAILMLSVRSFIVFKQYHDYQKLKSRIYDKNL
ncbi:MAG: DUF2752 domain-containing protein [Bacteroidetes bacterium]|nr:DUF2752 domain-containing protein [Bacteroidota bacterium]MBU1580410.1 DUF2752 domain-containing protein [Bacteroidota bacterium]MBU2465306.1 DUF2752 domain-containing protein [Bacteroidota bacterium]MBU2556175.1 DUF2752 domain-containing protein [Bacteroidota bacterium]